MQLLVKTLRGKVIAVDSLKPSGLVGHVKAKVLCTEAAARACVLAALNAYDRTDMGSGDFLRQ